MPTGPELYREAHDLLLSMPTDEELEADPELEERWTEHLCKWADASNDKVAAYRAVFRSAESRGAAFKAEAKRFSTAAKREERIQASMESLATLLLKGIEETTGEPVAPCADGSEVKLRRRKTPKIVSINMEELPPVYVITEKKPKKNAMLAVLRAGESIPGVEYDAERRTERVHWGP